MSSKDGEQVVEITGVSVDLTDDRTGKKSFTFTIGRTPDNGIEFDLLTTDNILYLDEKSSVTKNITLQTWSSINKMGC